MGQREQVDEDDVERIRIDLQLGAKFTPNTMRPIEPDNPGAERDARQPGQRRACVDGSSCVARPAGGRAGS